MLSLFDLFKIGIGPSSSHTVGPMIGAQQFAEKACRFIEQQSPTNSAQASPIASGYRLEIELFGSLALTGKGHATDIAVLAGLSGLQPSTCTTEQVTQTVADIRQSGILTLDSRIAIQFTESTDLRWQRTIFLPEHPNGMRYRLWGSTTASDSPPLLEEEYFSTGGGFVYTKKELLQLQAQEKADSHSDATGREESNPFPFSFCSADELLKICSHERVSISQIVDSNEDHLRARNDTNQKLDGIWQVMLDCIDRGCLTTGLLPGSLKIERRAHNIFEQLSNSFPSKLHAPSGLKTLQSLELKFSDPLQQMDWVSLFALAVNEENAAGGRVVTAPTNGAAGVIPAVIGYYYFFMPGSTDEGIRIFLKTAGAVGLLYKRNASLSAAEMGCQGEVGVACSMAAAGLAAVMGGTPEQIENAAEIGMEHNLGLTCDPIAGLVQIPCIERNTMGAVKAINAARLAVLYGSGRHFVSLDRVIETMRQTGVDMQSKYKETSLGGLAVNVVDC